MMKRSLILSLLLILASCGSYAEQTPAQLNAEALAIMQLGADQEELK